MERKVIYYINKFRWYNDTNSLLNLSEKLKNELNISYKNDDESNDNNNNKNDEESLNNKIKSLEMELLNSKNEILNLQKTIKQKNDN
jgi:hypothetical protein